MSIIRCERGHYFDNKRFDQCPHCAKLGGAEVQRGATASEAFVGTVKEARSENRTASLLAATMGANPVTGWLVCINGPEKGRDYRLHDGDNFIGRSWKMSICIVEDAEIVSENHAAVIYDSDSCSFLLQRGEGDTFLNGESVAQMAELHTGDMIRVGRSEFHFVPYCCKERHWG